MLLIRLHQIPLLIVSILGFQTPPIYEQIILDNFDHIQLLCDPRFKHNDSIIIGLKPSFYLSPTFGRNEL
jgi:hypothetical protein